MRRAVTAPGASDRECTPPRRVSALTPSTSAVSLLCACVGLRTVPAVHLRCHAHSLPHPSHPHSGAGSACAWEPSPGRRVHRLLPPISLLATRSASRRHTLRARSVMHSRAQLLGFTHTKRQCQCSIFYLVRERSTRRVPIWDARRLTLYWRLHFWIFDFALLDL